MYEKQEQEILTYMERLKVRSIKIFIFCITLFLSKETLLLNHPQILIEPTNVENIRSNVEVIAGNMKLEISRQLEKVGVQTEIIQRVPQSIRSLHKDSYDPQFVSFGPYHHDTKAQSPSNMYKWCFLRQILNMNKEVSLEKYLEEMDRNQKAKSCYDYEVSIQMERINDAIIRMLLLDGCCILGFLGILPLPQQQNDSFIITLWHHDSIRHDLFLMENQLSFTVLKQIYDLATGRTDVSEPHPLIEKVDEAIEKLLKPYPLITNGQNFDHLLHCCHLKFKPAMANSSSSDSKPMDELQRNWRGATDLHKAGIKFKPKLPDPLNKFSLLDVQLVSKNTLMIPTLKIEDSTNSVFRNLIAFEQSGTHDNYFVAYAFFMGELMGTPEDVTLLVNQGVVENNIGADKEVSDFFSNLVKGVVFDIDGEHFLRSTFKDLNSYYNDKRNKFLADLKQNYCGSPWLVISVVAATVVLVCTVVQTLFAVIK